MIFHINPTPEILLGPPGTGKTTRLIEIIREELARGTLPHEIALVTFTRQAANEAMERVAAEFSLTKDDFPNFRTIHSMCMRQTGITTKSVLEGDKLKEFADWIGEEVRGRQAVDGIWDGYASGDRLLFMDNMARIKRIPLRQLYESDHDDLDWAKVERFSRGLREYKRENKLFDFTDMLEQFVADKICPPIRLLLVDEAQDLSLLQWDVIAVLAERCERVVIAGDDDQAIFEWSGASAETLIDLEGRASVLDQSYRVPRRVQRIAFEIISRIRHRREKVWQPRAEDGAIKHIRNIGDADYAAPTGWEGPHSTMFLSRNRHLLDPVERELRAAGLLYSREGQWSVKRSTLSAIVIWERLRRGERVYAVDVVSGPYELMSVGIGVARGHKKLPHFPPDYEVSIEDLRNHGGLLTNEVWHLALDRMTAQDRLYLQKCRRNGQRLSVEPTIKISTIHGAKGGEADRVILLTDIAPRTWREKHNNPDAEARVLYVGVTRARSELCIVAPTTPRAYDI